MHLGGNGRHDALRRLAHDEGAAPPVGAELTQGPVRKAHRQRRGSRRHAHDPAFDGPSRKLVAEIREHAIDLCERKRPREDLHDRRRLFHSSAEHELRVAGDPLAKFIQIGGEFVRVTVPRVFQKSGRHMVHGIFDSLVQ